MFRGAKPYRRCELLDKISLFKMLTQDHLNPVSLVFTKVQTMSSTQPEESVYLPVDSFSSCSSCVVSGVIGVLYGLAYLLPGLRALGNLCRKTGKI